jgi:putative transposase
MKYQCIAEQAHEYPVVALCRALEVAASGYYAWKKRQPSAHRQEDERLESVIAHAFIQNRGAYGSPQVHAVLRRQGIRCARKRIARLMRQLGLTARGRKRKPRTTDSTHDHPIAPNVLNREFTASAPNQRWVGDMTVVETQDGWLYLAALIDLYSRRCVGWAMSAHPDEALVTSAFQMACQQRRPGPGLLHHSDRGSQYTSQGYRHLLASAGIQVSMSRRANCWDNAVVESFWGTLKTECTTRYQFASRQQAQTIIFDYLEIFYNRQRLHSTLGYLSPLEFECLPSYP